MVTGQTHRVLSISQADGARLHSKPGIQAGDGPRQGPPGAALPPPWSPDPSPGQALAGLLLALAESGHHGHKRPLGLEVGVLLKTLEKKVLVRGGTQRGGAEVPPSQLCPGAAQGLRDS